MLGQCDSDNNNKSTSIQVIKVVLEASMPVGVEQILLTTMTMEQAVGEVVDTSLAVEEGVGAVDVAVRMEGKEG